MLDIGIQELAVIGVLALLIFGPDKLPELGRRLGRAMREFRRASDEFRSTVEQNLQINVDTDISPPSPSPFEPTPTTSPADAGSSVVDGGPGHGAESAVAATSGADGVSISDTQTEPYWTSRGGRLLHRRECAWRARVAESERILFKTVQDGWDQGLKACPACVPPETEALV
jgi:TatA/E family protein of Tat protein translocase